MTKMKPAKIDYRNRIVTSQENTALSQPFIYDKGGLVVHADMRGAAWGYVVTVPSGYALGVYKNRSSAKKAMHLLHERLVDVHGDTLETLFGSPEAARNAYDSVRDLFV